MVVHKSIVFAVVYADFGLAEVYLCVLAFF